MNQRCSNPADSGYYNYGARGIGVCAEWKNSFATFYDHVKNLPHYGEEGYSLDRIDNEDDYKPGNVRWATRTEQNRNSRHAKSITFQGRTQCLEAWGKELGIKPATLQARLFSYGWSVERALTTPAQKWGR